MKTVFIETAWGDHDGMIQIERGEEFLSAARELGDFMNTLDLPADQHNKLVELTISQVLAAERNAFGEGLQLGRDYGNFEADSRQKATETDGKEK